MEERSEKCMRRENEQEKKMCIRDSPYTGEQYCGYQAVSGTIQSIYYPSGRFDDTSGTKCNSEDDRGAAGICGIFTADGECRDVTSDDQLQMCYAEAA